MVNNSRYLLMSSFPSFAVKDFDIDQYNERFKRANVIINASSRQVAYAEHWGCFSVKCVLNGTEYYKVGSRVYGVSNNNFLILNEGTYYSSYIDSKENVESFTINFSDAFIHQYFNGISENTALMETERSVSAPFNEKLYDKTSIAPILDRLRSAANEMDSRLLEVEEQYYQLFHQLLMQQKALINEIGKVKVVKTATKMEIYKRLHIAKDYIDSCYQEDVTLEKLASITFMNSAYLLRQFKSYFNITPRQYLIKRRMEAAARLLKLDSKSVTAVCHEVGYNDLTSFGKLFKFFYACTPEKFRNKR